MVLFMKKILTSSSFWISTSIIIFSGIMALVLVKILPGMPVVSDSVDYHTIAKNILENHIYITISDLLLIYPPLYPLFVAKIYSITHIGAYTAVYFAQYLLVGITAILTFFTLKKYFSVRTWIALLGAICVLSWPYFVLYSQIVSSEVVYIVLLVAFFVALLRISKDASWKIITFTGILLGLAILTRPVALLLLPWIIIGGFLLQKFFKIPESPLPYKKYFFIFLIALVTLVPWETYVVIQYHRIIPVASNLGAVFNKANKTLGYLSPTAEPMQPTAQNLIKAKIKNIYLFWNPGANGYHLDIIKEKYAPLKGFIVLYKIGFFILLGLAVSAFLWYRKNTYVLLAVLTIGYFWALHTVLFPFPRYMMPVVPFIIMLAMIATEKLATRYGKKLQTLDIHTGKK